MKKFAWGRKGKLVDVKAEMQVDLGDGTTNEGENERPRISRGGKNLIILGAASILVAILTTTVGLLIYHVSGDIYLDRSRPGFLPDEEEVEQDTEQKPAEYQFETNGNLTPEVLDEYAEHYEEELKAIDAYEKPFDESVLSDESLGIPSEKAAEAPAE